MRRAPIDHLLIVRRLVQTAAALFVGYIIWATKYPLRGFINPRIVFAFDPLVIVATALAQRVLLPALLLSGVTLVLTVILGRSFCGWLCPLGATLDCWAYLMRRFARRRYRERQPGRARTIKYGHAASLLLLALCGIQLAWAFDPVTIFVRACSFNILPWLNGGIDHLFGFALQRLGFPDWLDRTYQAVKENALNLSAQTFPHAGLIFAVFLAIILLAIIKRRFWCRYLCPLGGMLGLVARTTRFRRTVRSCNGCGSCFSVCRMNAIKRDNSCLPDECILCLDCAVRCPGRTTFSFGRGRRKSVASPAAGITRQQFLLGMAAAATAAMLAKPGALFGQPKGQRPVIRPPGALPEDGFARRCVRCGNCMKICITNVLQPALLESGWQGVWTPRFNTAIGYCEYQCNLCGQVCPTGAIRNLPLGQKVMYKIGTAAVHRQRCIPWTTGEGCLVCEEHCPIAEKAIKRQARSVNGRTVEVPQVDTRLCVGCAICEYKCPARPLRAITVTPL